MCFGGVWRDKVIILEYLSRMDCQDRGFSSCHLTTIVGIYLKHRPSCSATMHSPSPQLLRALRTSLSSSPRSVILRNLSASPRAVPSIPCPTLSPAAPLPATRRSNSSTPRPTRMTPRGHAHKPVSRDRGPNSAETTTTDFDALNVLGTMPAPTTGIDACLDNGFHLNSGVKVTGGDAVLLVGGEAFSWRPWKATEAKNDRAAKAAMINDKGQFELDEQAWGLLGAVWPRPGT